MSARWFRCLCPVAIFVALSIGPANAVDEIQVYNAEIAKIGQWTLQHHFNYAINGRKEPDIPGGLIPNRALNGTPELAYGVTDWYELGFYLPYAVDQNGQFLSNGAKIRHLFVSPDAQNRSFFYGVNFEFSYSMPRFIDTRWNVEIRPILGIRRGDYEYIVNPIVDVGIGSSDIEFLPAARLARKFSGDVALGVEYYSALGAIGRFPTFNEQQHNIYAVVDFKVGKLDVNAGLGYGLTGGSDRLMAKLILGMDLNDGKTENSERTLLRRLPVR